jgi:hypothetical protein
VGDVGVIPAGVVEVEGNPRFLALAGVGEGVGGGNTIGIGAQFAPGSEAHLGRSNKVAVGYQRRTAQVIAKQILHTACPGPARDALAAGVVVLGERGQGRLDWGQRNVVKFNSGYEILKGQNRLCKFTLTLTSGEARSFQFPALSGCIADGTG